LAPNAPRPAVDPEAPGADSFIRFPDNRLLIDLCGELDRNLAQIEAGSGC
jgi:phosphate starvation-inducible protein PhoH and related proteins